MQPAVHRSRGGGVARAALSAFLLIVLAAPGPGSLAQAREWWDLYDEAKRVIENEKAGQSDLEGARRKLMQAIRAKETEGNLETYNPNVRVIYLPHVYLGWANLRLGRYDEAERNFRRSDEIGYIRKGAPQDLRSRFDSLRELVTQLKPAAEALTSVKGNALAGQCMADPSSAAGKRIKEMSASIEAFLSAPSDAARLKAWTEALNTAIGECVKEIKGVQIARLSAEYQAARDAVMVEGILGLLSAETQRDLNGAVATGKEAEGQGDEDGLRTATRRLRDLPPRVGRDVDARIASLARDAESIARGSERALNEQNQLGSRLRAGAAEAGRQKASGKTGGDLAAVVKVAADLMGLVETARAAIAPILQAKGTALDAARRDFESWSGSRSCEIAAVGAREAVAAVLKEAAGARSGESADAMDAATARLASSRADVESRLRDALPRVQEEASGILQNSADVVANVPDAGQKARGEGLRSAVEQAAAGKDVCAIETAIGELTRWVDAVAPRLRADRDRAIARNRPILDESEKLIAGFGGILKAETVSALRPPMDRLAGLVKSSYDAATMDQAGREVQGLVDRARGEIQGQMQEAIRALRGMRSDPRWANVTPARRQWLEQNLSAAERAVATMSEPDLLARFAREYPRARIEIAMASAFSTLYEQGDAAKAAGELNALGPALRTGSAAVSFALAYMYWWQGQSASPSEREALMAEARKAYEAGRSLQADLAGIGGSLFAPAFVDEMSRR